MMKKREAQTYMNIDIMCFSLSGYKVVYLTPIELANYIINSEWLASKEMVTE